MAFTLPALPYAHDALQPYMSKETLEFHHDKHHNTYVETANKLLEGSGLENASLEEVVKQTHGKNLGGYDQCAPGCKLGPRCGDGIVQTDKGETCDDGNAMSGDGCSAACKPEVN